MTNIVDHEHQHDHDHHHEEHKGKCHNCLKAIKHACACIFKKKDPFGEGLTLHHSLSTTRKKFKPWAQLNPEERHEKILYLWKQTRRYFWQQVIMFRIAKSSEANIQVTVIDEDEVLEN